MTAPKLSLFYPVKPLWINQAFGIYNPAYEQFGFNKHNGIDFSVIDGQIAYAMHAGYVTEVGEQKGAGKFVRFRTYEPVEIDGVLRNIGFIYMHARKQLVRVGQTLKPGDPIMECDNTGFSTGHHLHVSVYFADWDGSKLPIGDPDSDYCIDYWKYFNRFYAQDAQKVIGLYIQLLTLLKQVLKQ